MSRDALSLYLESVRQRFRQYKELADRALLQVPDAALAIRLDDESNSIATLMQHMTGNLVSRWTDFLTSDGEKPSRRRDAEFEDDLSTSRETLTRRWEEAWSILFAAVDGLTPADLDRIVTIRGEPHSVVDAINRQVAHYGYHVGQIVLLAKHFRQTDWKTLSIARHRPTSNR